MLNIFLGKIGDMDGIIILTESSDPCEALRKLAVSHEALPPEEIRTNGLTYALARIKKNNYELEISVRIPAKIII